MAINWPGWKEVGSVANLKPSFGVEAWKDEALKKAILTKDGLEAFRRALASGLPQVIVSPENLDHAIAQSVEATGLLKTKPGQAPALHGVQNTGTDLPGDEIETAVSGIWSGVFGIGRMGIHEQFADLGGHSLLAMQILAKIRGAYRVEITLRDFFGAPTIAELSAVIRDKILREIEAMSDDEVRKSIAEEAPAHG